MTRSLAELRQHIALEILFNNDFQDTSGNGNDGTPTDIEWKPTLRGMKPRLNGSTSSVNCGNGDTLNITNEITMVSIVKYHADPTTFNGMLSNKTDYNLYSRIASSGVLCEIRTLNGLVRPVIPFSSFNPYEFNIIIGTYDGQNVKVYLNGIEIDTLPQTGLIISNSDDYIIGRTGADTLEFNGIISTDMVLDTALTPDEVTLFDAELQKYHGVMPVEHSFTHNPDDVIDPSGAVGAWGTAKESTTELIDLSGNGNIADIHGAMPTEGFIQGRRFTAANSNYLDCGNTPVYCNTGYSIICIVSGIANQTNVTVYGEGSSTADQPMLILSSQLSNKIDIFLRDDTNTAKIPHVKSTRVFYDDTPHIAIFTDLNGTCKLYIDGILDETDFDYVHSTLTLNTTTIGAVRRTTVSSFMDIIIYYIASFNHIITQSEAQSFFNTLARLPFWSVNYTDYPDNVTTYTDNLPYSSSIILSGTFKVDDDVLNCVSAGTMTYSASYEFDGSEYIKIEIDGVEYAGTGTITQGNTTVSVAQGSNKITIAMGTADTIDKVRIQFREEV